MVVYLGMDTDGRQAEVTVDGVTYYYSTQNGYTFEANMVAGAPTYDWLIASNTTPGDYSQTANVAIFNPDPDPNLVIEFNCLDNSGIAGFQIVEIDLASNPIPLNRDTMIKVDQMLSWTAPITYTPTGYDVYLDPNEAEVIAGDPSVRVSANHPGETYTPAGILLYGTTYYSRIDSLGLPDPCTGVVWNFTTDVHPSTLEPPLYAPGITIGNPSFEKESGWWQATSDWFDNGGAYQEPVVPTPYGTVLGCLEPDGTHWQPIGTLQHNTDYVISWGVSKRPGYGDGGTKASLWYATPASVPADQATGDATTPIGIGATKIAETVAYTSGVDNQFVEVSQTLNTGTGGVDEVDTLLIQYINGLGTGRGYFDMVRVNLPRDGRSVWGPTPLNGEVDIAPSAPLTLSWEMGVDPATNYQPLTNVASYKVYFGIDPNALVYQGTTSVGTETLVITPTMIEFSPYLWRVDQVLTDTSEITGPTWEFTTSLSDRLVAHWKFEDNLYDTVDDLTGNAAGDWPGTMTDPNFEAGIDGQAVRFYRGDGRILTIEGSEDFFNFYGEGLTVNMWYKPDDYAVVDGFEGLIAKGSSDWRIFDTATYYSAGAEFKIDPLAVDPSGRLDDGNWHMLTITYDETATPDPLMTAYVDGKSVGTAAGAVSSGSAAKVVMGAINEAGEWQYSGLMDDVKIYSYALDAYHVAKLYTDLVAGAEICAEDLPVEYDYNGDCIVDLKDFANFANHWLDCNIVPTCWDG